MIKRLHLLVIKSYIGPLVMTFFIAEFVLIMHFLWLYIEDLVGKGLEWTVVAELMLYASAGLVKMALPLAILLASIMTFGNFGEHFELSAMKSAGLSLQRIMMPLIIFSVILSVASFFWSNNVIPYTNLKTGALLYDVSNQRPELNIKPGIFNREIEGYTIKIKSKSSSSPMMYDFMIYDHKEKRGNPKIILADSGFMQVNDNQKFMIITLYSGKVFEEMNEKNPGLKVYPERHDIFDKQTIIIELKGFDLERTDEALFKHHYQMKTIKELQYSKDSLEILLKERKKQFLAGLNQSKFFKYSNYMGTRAKDAPDNEPDENLTKKIIQNKSVGNIDSLFKSMNIDEKERICNSAMESATNARSQIESNKIDITERQKNIFKHDIAWHEKFTLSFACLIFFFIGAPLGAIIRKGGLGLPFLVSILFFIVYYIISIFGRKLVEESAMLPWQGMWLSSLLTLPLGVLFTYKATTDSALFDIGAYVEVIKKPFKMLQINYKDPTVVFHRDVEIPKDEVIQSSLIEFEGSLKELMLNIGEKTTSFKKVYLNHFKNDHSNLKILVEEYNVLYDILSVRYRDRKFLKASLEKFPKIEFEKYFISKRKIIANYFFLTILFFPLGLYFMLISNLKLKVLRQKMGMVMEQIAFFKETKLGGSHESDEEILHEKNSMLKMLENNKLIDIVKNYKQYRYETTYRESALQILQERGITLEELSLTGNLKNLDYENASNFYKSFIQNSKLAFIFYISNVLIAIALKVLLVRFPGMEIAGSIILVASFILFFVFLIKSFFNQSQFYKAIGKDYGVDGALIYMFVGMPFYVVMYFFFKNQMNENMKEIK